MEWKTLKWFFAAAVITPFILLMVFGPSNRVKSATGADTKITQTTQTTQAALTDNGQEAAGTVKSNVQIGKDGQITWDNGSTGKVTDLIGKKVTITYVSQGKKCNTTLPIERTDVWDDGTIILSFTGYTGREWYGYLGRRIRVNDGIWQSPVVDQKHVTITFLKE